MRDLCATALLGLSFPTVIDAVSWGMTYHAYQDKSPLFAFACVSSIVTTSLLGVMINIFYKVDQMDKRRTLKRTSSELCVQPQRIRNDPAEFNNNYPTNYL